MRNMVPSGMDDRSTPSIDTNTYHPVVIDIETTASPPQRPIIMVAYDTYDETAIIAVNFDEINRDVQDMDDISDAVVDGLTNHVTVDDTYNEIITDKTLERIITNIVDFNRSHKNNDSNDRKCIAAHNALFDVGIMGHRRDDLIDEDYRFKRGDVDGVIEYGDIKIGHKSAGAHGRIYQVYDNMTPVRVPVIDTMTVAKSVWLPPSLSDLGDALGVDVTDADTHNGTLSDDYAEYCGDDVGATTNIIYELREYLDTNFSISDPIHRIYSSAGLAKSKILEAGYTPVDYTDDALDIITPSYFGGQTEALRPGEIVENVDYADILSQYPTVSALTGVWEFMRAERVEIERIYHGIDYTLPDLDELKNPDVWDDLSNIYCVVEAEDALLPVRTTLESNENTKIYKAQTTHDDGEGTIHHIYDVIGAMILSDDGANIDIKSSYKAIPTNLKTNDELNAIKIGGTEIGAGENVMKKGIEERKRIQYEINGGEKDEKTKALKIVANSIYGITAERILEKEYDDDGDIDNRQDVAGIFYNPAVASTITAGGRLMLSIAEAITDRADGDMVYCDTDSVVVTDGTDDIVNYFDKLNPYDGIAGDLDVMEVEYSSIDIIQIGVKKYALISDAEIIEAKSHGIGHFRELRDYNMIKKFWSELINMLTDTKIKTPSLSNDDMSAIVSWETSVSSYHTADIIDNYLDESVRYGDFAVRSVKTSDGESNMYIWLDRDYILQISEDGDIDIIDSLDNAEIKTVRDVLSDWYMMTLSNKPGRPTVTITNQSKICKEAIDIKQSWDRHFDTAFQKLSQLNS